MPDRALSLSRGRHKVELRHRRILRALAWAYPAPLSLSDMIAAVYFDREEPDSAHLVVRKAIHDLRDAGWAITCFHNVGYRLEEASYDRLTLPVAQTKGRAR
jgi:hypothetical protein